MNNRMHIKYIGNKNSKWVMKRAMFSVEQKRQFQVKKWLKYWRTDIRQCFLNDKILQWTGE